MAGGHFKIRRAIIITYLIGVHLLAGYLLVKEVLLKFGSSQPSIDVVDPTVNTPIPLPIPVPSVLADLRPVENTENASDLQLIVPVKGMTAERLTDSYNDARGDSRSHEAIDIVAPEGTPVIAAADGVIARFFDSVPGGITIYQFTEDRKYMLYYAHLQRRADGLSAGDRVSQGQLIGYVGDTGNAGKGNFHLHFSVARVTDSARYWEGEYVNPFPMFRRSTP